MEQKTTDFGTATKRQRWALYCLTKQDFRTKVLDKEVASSLIKDLMDKKNAKPKKTVTVYEELRDYLKERWDSIMKSAMPSMDEKSVVETEWNGDVKHYAFIGVGCGITYLTHRKGNKKAEAIKEAANKIHYNEALNWFMDKFTSAEQKYYEMIGCPLGAIWTQDQNMQQAYYYAVLDFAKSKGVKMDVKSFLD